MTNENYGKQIAVVLAAIEQLYADSSKLLQDCDGSIGKGKNSIFGNEVTRDLSRAISGHAGWMPTALYRYYDASKQAPGLVEGVTICFRDEVGVDPPRLEEPLLLVGQIQYHMEDTVPLRSLVLPWTLWNCYFLWSQTRPLNEVISYPAELDRGIPKMKVIVVPLFSINSVVMVQQLLERVDQFTGR